MGNSLWPNLLCAQLVAVLSESVLVGWGVCVNLSIVCVYVVFCNVVSVGDGFDEV